MICAKEHFLSQLHFKLNFDLCWELIFAMILKKIINCCREKPNNMFVFYVWKSNFSGLIQASSVSIFTHLEEIIGYPRCCKLKFSLCCLDWPGLNISLYPFTIFCLTASIQFSALPGQFFPLFLLLFLFLGWCQALGVCQIVYSNGQEDIQQDVCSEWWC